MALDKFTQITKSGIVTTINFECHHLYSTGIATFSSGNISAVDGTFTGDVSIGGTLTYQDVTNIDSVGLVTARLGLNVTAGVSTFAALIDANGGVDISGGSGLVASTAKISDLTDNRVVIGGSSGELEDSANLTFDGSNLGVGSKVTVTNANADSRNVNSLGADINAAWIRIGDKAAAKTFSNGLGIKFYDQGTAHWSTGTIGNQYYVSYTGSAGDELFPSSRVDALTFNTTGAAVFASDITAGGNLYIPDRIYHASDTNTQIRFPANDTISFETAGDERLRITSDGHLRIQHATTNGKLILSRNVSVTSTNTSIGVVDFACNTAHTVQARLMGKTLGTSNVGGDLVVETRAEGGSLDERVRFTGSGKLLIGTSGGRIINSHEPRLQISGNDYKQSTVSIINNAADATGAYLFLTKQRSGSGGGNTAVSQNDLIGDIRFTAGDGTDVETGAARITVVAESNASGNSVPSFMRFSTNGGSGSADERLRIHSDGQTTIGNDHAGAGTWDGQLVVATTTGGIITVGDTGSGEKLHLEGGAGAPRIGTNSNHDLKFFTNGTSNERLRIESGGDVSIGGMDANTFSNYRTLTIGGAGASDGAGIDLEKSDGNIYGRFFADANGVQLQTAQSGDYFRFETHNGSGVGERLRITSAGYVGINETNPSYQLDVKGDTGATFSAGSNSTAGMITISGRNSGGSGSALSRLKSYPDGSSTQSHFAIETRNSSASMIERFRITSTGEINFANVTVAQKNTSGDIVIDISNLTNNGSNYWRKVGVWIMYNGIKPDATNNYSVVYYAGVGSVSTWNWLGDQDTLTSDSFSSVALQNAAATSFRLYCDINNQNVGNVFVMVHAWNTKPTVTIN